LNCLAPCRALNVARMKPNTGGPAFLGLDCGGTRSIAIYEYGNIQRRAEAGPGNARLLSEAQLLALLRSFRAIHKGLPSPAAVIVGMAGARTETDRARVRRAAEKIWPRTPCQAVGDLDNALAAAEIEERIGENKLSAMVVALSGTGSCFFGRNARGQYAKVGGWGHIVGDKGSAFEIGLRALKAVLFYFDRDGRVPPLGRQLLRTLMLNELNDIPPWALTASKTEIAALAREVSAAARHGDRIARDILAGAAHSIATDALTCAARLTRPGERVKFVLAGSVLLHQPAFQRQVAKWIRKQWRGAEIIPLKHEAALGALSLAKQLAGFKVQGPKFNIQTLPRVEHWTSDIELTNSPTEQRNPLSMKLDKLTLERALMLMLSEDKKIPGAILAERTHIVRAVRSIVRSFKSDGRLIYVGAGTSGRLGVLDASECPPTFRTDPELVQGIIAGGQVALWRAVEGAEDDPAAGARAVKSRGTSRRDTVVGIAASGRTPFVWGALDEAKRCGATTVLLTFNPHLKIPRAHHPDILIAPNVGPEILTGSTRLKSGTATKLILNIFTTLAMVQTGKILSNLMVDVKPSNVKLRDRAVRIVQTLTGLDQTAARRALERADWVIKDAVRYYANAAKPLKIVI
jgi:N-acetylmuramic acid 6-phosphate etherase